MNNKTQIRIFIVEDNKLFALALKTDIETAFANIPCKIFLFETGEMCMEKFKEEKPQIVILDYHLNSSDSEAANGIKVLDRIIKEYNETNVIMLTRDDDIDIAIKAFKHGASDFIIKTDTQFRKIIFSLFNLFRLIKSKKEALRYKRITIVLCLSVAILVGVAIAIQAFYPSLFVR
ncbi:MAG: response regulator [Bacteroidota bacterium]